LLTRGEIEPEDLSSDLAPTRRITEAMNLFDQPRMVGGVDERVLNLQLSTEERHGGELKSHNDLGSFCQRHLIGNFTGILRPL